ncbi:stellacyanin-like [Durio zibethinus]|uniref:Stellacyanin-like n=1 Tax=Durio zibethinus TaxID=66656 RepID=A0A6P5XU73_DURZI|nr:stellacyanin-like [Durio zibethinus]
MGRILNIVFLAAIAIATMLQSSSARTTYVVGDALGWLVPPGPAVYTIWAANKTFRVGDTLVFNFATGAHSVARVTRANYDACNAASPLFLLSESPATVTLDETGDYYFLCAFPGHCSLGQKFAINVSAAA